jgi:hypothetical protein
MRRSVEAEGVEPKPPLLPPKARDNFPWSSADRKDGGGGTDGGNSLGGSMGGEYNVVTASHTAHSDTVQLNSMNESMMPPAQPPASDKTARYHLHASNLPRAIYLTNQSCPSSRIPCYRPWSDRAPIGTFQEVQFGSLEQVRKQLVYPHLWSRASQEGRRRPIMFSRQLWHMKGAVAVSLQFTGSRLAGD